MLKLTIIIPHYNTPVLLVKLLSTIPPLPWLETIIVDDKSQKSLDKIEEYIDQHRDQSIYLLHNTTDKKGAGICRNIALEQAKGEYVLFSDADDYFTDKFKEAVSEYLEKDFDVVYFYPTSIYSDTGETASRHINFKNILDSFREAENHINELRLRYGIPNPVSKMIKRELIMKNSIYFDETRVSNDVMFSVKVGFPMSSFAISENIIYCITRGPESLTTTMSKEVFDTRFSVFLNYVRYLKDRIPGKDYKLLKISGIHHIIRSRNYGLAKVVSTIRLLRRNQIRLFVLNSINISKVMRLINKRIKERKYYSRK